MRALDLKAFIFVLGLMVWVVESRAGRSSGGSSKSSRSSHSSHTSHSSHGRNRGLFSHSHHSSHSNHHRHQRHPLFSLKTHHKKYSSSSPGSSERNSKQVEQSSAPEQSDSNVKPTNAGATEQLNNEPLTYEHTQTDPNHYKHKHGLRLIYKTVIPPSPDDEQPKHDVILEFTDKEENRRCRCICKTY